MKKTFIKIVIREIKESLGRFVAIFAIVALGVGFLAGLLSTTPNMKESMDQYYDQSNMTDIFIKSTMGLTEEDLKTISKLDEIEKVMPAYVTDALMEVNNEKVLPTRIYGLSNEAFESEKRYGTNQLKLIKGRMPILKSECVIERSGGYLSEISIGSTLKISPDNEDYDKIDDAIKGGTAPGNTAHDVISNEVKNVNKQLVLYKYIRNFELRDEEFAKTTTRKIQRYKELK